MCERCEKALRYIEKTRKSNTLWRISADRIAENIEDILEGEE